MSLDFRPDAPFAPNILQQATFLLPDKSGFYRNSYSASQITNYQNLHLTMATAVKGSRMVQYADGTPNWFFGNSTKLVELNGSTVYDVSRAVGGAYTGSNRWWFEQFGDATIASNYSDATQVRTSSAAGALFSGLSGAPKAKFFLSQSGFLLACNYDDGTATPNGIKWATEGSTTTWTAATGNTAGNAILRETPGQIVAGAQIHNIVAIWKKNSMYVGQVVGGAGTEVWDFRLLSPKVGCASQEAWAATPIGIIFVSPNNGIYKFDGSIPVPIDGGIRQDFYRNVSTTSSIQVTHDEASQCVFIWTASNLCYAYNYSKDKWGLPYQGSALGNANFTTFVCGVRDANYDDYITLGGTADANRRCHLVWSSEREVCNLNTHTAGTGINAQYSIINVRDTKAAPDELTLLKRVIPIHAFNSESGFYDAEPNSGTLTIAPKDRMGAASSSSATVSLDSNKRYDCLGANPTANTLSLSFAHTAQTMILADLLYDTQIAGKK